MQPARSFHRGLGLALLLAFSQAAFARDVPIEERIRAQTAVERVYWLHRIWPEGSPTTKPAFTSAVPDAVIRDKVVTALEQSVALESLWGESVGPDRLQAEMDRMARDTRDPTMLKELFSALQNDPALIAECLARPVLVERLLRNHYASDSRQHAAARTAALAAVAAGIDVRDVTDPGSEVAEVTWIAADQVSSGAAEGVTDSVRSHARTVDAEVWKRLRHELCGASPGSC